MFWRFGGYSNVSAIDTLLDKPDVTLEELLDESELVQELKQQNTKLIEYLQDEKILRRLFHYVVAPPPTRVREDSDEDIEEAENDSSLNIDENDVTKTRSIDLDSTESQDEVNEEMEKLRMKYAFVSSEILSNETWSIIEAVMDNKHLLREFWDYLKRKAPLDPLQATYFTKINDLLLNKKTGEVLDFFKSLDGVVDQVLQHVDCPVIMDLLLKIISLNKVEGGQGIVQWLHSQNLIPILLSYLAPDYPQSTQTSAGDFIKAIITISANASANEPSCIGPNELTRQLVSEECISTLISNMLQGGNSLTVGVGIIIEVIRKNNSDYDPDLGAAANAPPTSHDPIYLGRLLHLFAQHVPDFMKLMNEPNIPSFIKQNLQSVKSSSPYGSNIEPLGFDRFKTCELMAELLHCSNMALLNERGSDAYIKQRDVERERLKAEGTLDMLNERQSAVGLGFTEDSSVLHDFESSQINEESMDVRKLSVINNSEDDEFEDVTAPDSSEEAKDDLVERSEGLDNMKKTNRTSDLGDELVGDVATSARAGPLTATNPDKKEPELGENAGGNSSHPHDASAIELSQEGASSQSDARFEADHREGNRGASSDDHEPLSHPEDTPAPLFAHEHEKFESMNTTGPNPMYNDNQATLENAPDLGESIIVTPQRGTYEYMIQPDIDGAPLVGDYLKMQFVDNRVIPTIFELFFRFPWNNFLHNVVYDVVQQVFNGPMERGYNRFLAIDLFETGRITERIVEGQQRSDDAQQINNMRLGYMGHLTLVAEEVVKFSEKYSAEILSQSVLEKFLDRQWIEYVEQTLSETRERDNAILGGVRPDPAGGRGLGDINSQFNTSGSAALTNAGLNMENGDLSNNGGNMAFGFIGGFTGDEDEMMEEGEGDEYGRGNFRNGPSENFPNLSSLASKLSFTSNQPVSEATSSEAPSIPVIPPPPPPLNIPPSRARRQFAARLAAQQEQQQRLRAEQHSDFGSDNTDSDASSDGDPASFAVGDSEFPDPEPLPLTIGGRSRQRDPFQDDVNEFEEDGNDPFAVISSPFQPDDEQEHELRDEGILGSSPPISTSPYDKQERGFSSKMAELYSSTRTDSSSSSSSSLGSDDDDDDSGMSGKGKRRPSVTHEAVVRMPIDDDDDDDEMGEMVGPMAVGDGNASFSFDDDEEDDEPEGGDLVAVGRVQGRRG